MADEFVCLATYRSELTANPVVESLASAGIPAILDNAEVGNAFTGVLLGWTRLMIPREQLETALQLFEANPWMNDGADAERPKGDRVYCLACGIEMGELWDRCRECGWSYLTGGSTEEE